MCIIVDADSAHHLSNLTEHGKPVMRWLLKGRGGLVVGGEIKRELTKGGLRETMVILDQAGRLKKLDDKKVDDLAKEIKKSGKCQSNDHHVIAVALISGCRLLYSSDQALHEDAKNCEILNPTASIYKSKDHQHLLTECNCG